MGLGRSFAIVFTSQGGVAVGVEVGVPVIVGVSAPGFAAMRALTQDVMALGAAGVMIAPPNTLRTDDSIVQYYKQASEAIGADVPFVIQDYPLTFSVQMTPGVIRRIVTEEEVDGVVQKKSQFVHGGFDGEGGLLRPRRPVGPGSRLVGQHLVAAQDAPDHAPDRPLARRRQRRRHERRAGRHDRLLPDVPRCRRFARQIRAARRRRRTARRATAACRRCASRSRTPAGRASPS